MVILAMTALTLVQRVQDDPLEAGAEQVARLSIDQSYDIPQFFENWAGERGMAGFHEFYGLRPVVAYETGNALAGGDREDCLDVFSAADMQQDSEGFSGLLVIGCSSGGFPAAIEFSTAAPSVPEELISAFPDATAFQLVLDSDNSEVVVFMTR